MLATVFKILGYILLAGIAIFFLSSYLYTLTGLKIFERIALALKKFIKNELGVLIFLVVGTLLLGRCLGLV